MRVDVISLFPERVEPVGEFGVVGRAVKNQQLQLDTWNPRDFTEDRHRTVDDRSYGGGPGMVMMNAPLEKAVQAAKAKNSEAKVIYLSPKGERFSQAWAERLAAEPGMILLCGRYEGVDERFLDTQVDMELSIGDFVLSGGELAAMVVIDAVARLIPGVLGAAESAKQDSFAEGLLDHPHYTRPEVYKDQVVPDVLLSGNHAAIARWRLQQALGHTWLRRPDLLEGLELNKEQRQLLDAYIAETSAELN